MYYGTKLVSLTVREAEVFAFLWRHRDRAVSRDELLVEVYGYKPGLKTRALDNTVTRLRKKIEPDPRNPMFLQTVMGTGYALRGAVASGPRPGAATGIVGRRAALAALEAALTEVAWVAVAGPGGIGKSTLVRVLLDRPSLSRRVWCPLGDAADEAAVEARVARALRVAVREPGELRRILAAQGPLVLLLDGADTIADVLDRVVPAWVAVAPDLRVVVTTRRAPSAVPQVIELGPLPEDDARALYSRHAYATTAGGPRLLDQLEGIPLAIQLAASRTRLLAPEELAEKIQTDRRWLAGTTPGGEHRSLQAVIEASWRLAGPDDQAALQQLAQLRGPFDVALAADVLGVDVHAAVEQLERLAATYFVRAATEPMRSFRLYNDVAAFARGTAQPPEVAGRYVEAIRRRALALLEGARFMSRTVEARRGMGWLFDDTAAAIGTAVEVAPDATPDLLLVAIRTLQPLGFIATAEPLLRQALTVRSRMGREAGATFDYVQAVFLRDQGQTEKAEAVLREALARPDLPNAGLLWGELGKGLAWSGRFAEATKALTTAVEHLEKPFERAAAEMVLARLDMWQRHHSEAEERMWRVLLVAEEQDLTVLGEVHDVLGRSFLWSDRFEEAASHLASAVAAHKQADSHLRAMASVSILGHAQTWLHRYDEANQSLREAEAWALGRGHEAMLNDARADLGYLRLCQKRWTDAEHLLRGAIRTATSLGRPRVANRACVDLARLRLHQGLYEDAVSNLDAGEAAMADTPHNLNHWHAQQVRGLALALMGRSGEAEDVWLGALEGARENREPRLLSELTASLAAAAADRDGPEEARRLLATADFTHRGVAVHKAIALLHVDLCDARATGEAADLARVRRRAAGIAAQPNKPFLVEAALWLLDRALDTE